MSFLRKIALYIYLCVYVCANLYIRDANKYFNISVEFTSNLRILDLKVRSNVISNNHISILILQNLAHAM